MATVDVIVGSSYLTDERAAHLAMAESLTVKALSLAPGHAFAHLILGFVLNATNRIDQAMASASERWRWIETWPPTVSSALGWQFIIGRGAETGSSCPASVSALSPRYPSPSPAARCRFAKLIFGAALERSHGNAGRSRPTGINRRALLLAAALHCRVRWSGGAGGQLASIAGAAFGSRRGGGAARANASMSARASPGCRRMNSLLVAWDNEQSANGCRPCHKDMLATRPTCRATRERDPGRTTMSAYKANRRIQCIFSGTH